MAFERFRQEECEGVTIATLFDRKILDEVVIQVIGNQLYHLVDEEECSQLVIDFRNVEYMSSVFLGKLCNLKKKLNEAGGTLVLCELRPDIFDLFVFARLRNTYIFADTRELALEQF